MGHSLPVMVGDCESGTWLCWFWLLCIWHIIAQQFEFAENSVFALLVGQAVTHMCVTGRHMYCTESLSIAGGVASQDSILTSSGDKDCQRAGHEYTSFYLKSGWQLSYVLLTALSVGQ